MIFEDWSLIVLFVSIVQAASSTQLIPLLQYDMTTDACHRGTFFNNGILGNKFMTLIRNVNTTKCSLGMGIEGDFHSSPTNSDEKEISNSLYSSMSIASFLGEVRDNSSQIESGKGFTISLWIRPLQNQEFNKQNGHGSILASRRTIFTIGSDTSNGKTFSNRLTSCSMSQIDLQLSIIDDNSLELVYRTSNNLLEPFQRIQCNASSLWNADDESMFSSKPTHISISLAHFHQQVLVNGKVMARRREAFDNYLNHWNPNSLLQFFNYANDCSRESFLWDGQLFQFGIYSNILNIKEVRSVIAQGLPPSQPYPRPKIAYIYEDATDENKTLQEIQMTYSFLDAEIEKLLILLGIYHQPVARVRYYITRFPTRGNLFHIGGEQQIESSGIHPVLLRGINRIVYKPRKDEHSEFHGHSYSSFDFCVTTNKIISSSQCISATISVVVESINDPPVADIPPPYYVHEGIIEETQAILLTGSDVDKNDFIQTIQITNPPEMGYLLLSVSSFRKADNLYHGTLLSTINYTVPGNEVYVEYRFNKYDEIALQDVSVIDFFRFRVQDSAGSWSAEAEVKVHVVSSISSFPLPGSNHSIPTKAQDGGVRKTLMGIDKSGMNRTLGFFIRSLPSKGFIRDDEGNELIENGVVESTDIIQDAKENIMTSLNITYIGVPTLCENSHSIEVNDKFQYQVVALGEDKGVVSASPTEEQQISIYCPVKLISVSVVDELLTDVSAFVSSVNDRCSGYLFDFKEESRALCSDVALVFGLHVENVENLQDPIYVFMTTHRGLLSLKEDHFTHLRPISDQPLMRSSIRIILPAEHLNDVLSAIHFQSETVGRDEIQVALQYGRCDHNETFLIEHDFSETTSECYKVEKTIYVNVQEDSQALQLLRYPFPWIPLLIILMLGPLFYIKGKIRQTIEDVCLDWKDDTPPYLATETSTNDV